MKNRYWLALSVIVCVIGCSRQSLSVRAGRTNVGGGSPVAPDATPSPSGNPSEALPPEITALTLGGPYVSGVPSLPSAQGESVNFAQFSPPAAAMLAISSWPDVNFGNQELGSEMTVTVYVANLGLSPASDVQLAFGKEGSDFSIVAGDCGNQIAPRSRCSVQVHFSPSQLNDRWQLLRAKYSQPSGTASYAYRVVRGKGIVPASIACPALEQRVERNADGRLALFAIAPNGTVWQTSEIAPHSGEWYAWQNLGGNIKNLRAIRNADGHLEIFGIGTDTQVYQNWQQTPGGAWSGWYSLGGSVLSLEITRNQDGRLEAFVLAPSGEVYHNWQPSPSTGTWPGWASLSGGGTSLHALRDSQGRLNVFVVAANGLVYANRQVTASTGSWTGWQSLNGAATSIEVNEAFDGGLEIIATRVDSNRWGLWQLFGSDLWSEWTRISP